MTMELDASFESQLREQVLDEAEESLAAEDSVVSEAIERSHERLEAVASAHDYEVENVVDSLEGPEVRRENNRIVVEYGWTHKAAAFFERGTADHTVTGNPVLAFEWPDAPAEVAEDYPETFPLVFFRNTDPSGIEQSRYARHGLEWLRRELEAEGL